MVKKKHNIPLILSIITLLGFVFSSGAFDYGAAAIGKTGFFNKNIAIRVSTVFIPASIAIFILGFNRKFHRALNHNLLFLFCYFLLTLLSVIFSNLKIITIYKGLEILAVIFIAATVYTSSNNYKSSKILCYGILWCYGLTVLLIWLQFFFLGSEVKRELYGQTPLINFMLISKYPAMVGNSTGYIGAIVTLFGLFLLELKKFRKVFYTLFGFIFCISGILLVFFSYTRSILVFLVLSILLLFTISKKYFLLISLILCILLSLSLPFVRSNIINHMKRGQTEEKLSTFNNRLTFWGSIIKRDPFQLFLGEGFGTGTIFQNVSAQSFKKKIFRARNAHNSVFEIIMSIGFFGAAVWIFLVTRIFYLLLSFYLKYHTKIKDFDLFFLRTIIVIFFLSLLRSIMNSTFVYLDYFYFIFISIAVYADSLKLKEKELLRKTNS